MHIHPLNRFWNVVSSESRKLVGDRPKVLVIDDSPTVRVFTARVLEQAGYNVIVAANAREGWQKVLQERPRCLLLDIVLPDVSGFQACRHFRASVPKQALSIILISTKNTNLDKTWGMRQGADDYLVKPFSEEILLQAVQNALAKQPA